MAVAVDVVPMHCPKARGDRRQVNNSRRLRLYETVAQAVHEVNVAKKIGGELQVEPVSAESGRPHHDTRVQHKDMAEVALLLCHKIRASEDRLIALLTRDVTAPEAAAGGGMAGAWRGWLVLV